MIIALITIIIMLTVLIITSGNDITELKSRISLLEVKCDNLELANKDMAEIVEVLTNEYNIITNIVGGNFKLNEEEN